MKTIDTGLFLLSFSYAVVSSPVPGIALKSRPQSNPLNPILALLVGSPILGASVNKLSDSLTALEVGLAQATGVDTSENGTGTCAPMSVIFARGTTEPGNVGLVTGPPFFDALESMLGQGNVDVQGVDYGASIEGFLQGGDADGSQTMATMIQNTISKCPDTKIVMSGYSQGGQLVHNAALLLPPSTMDAVSSVVIFGDPNNGLPVNNVPTSKTMVICHPDDNICQHGDLILIAHLTYSQDAQQAATFAATQAGMAINS